MQTVKVESGLGAIKYSVGDIVVTTAGRLMLLVLLREQSAELKGTWLAYQVCHTGGEQGRRVDSLSEHSIRGHFYGKLVVGPRYDDMLDASGGR